MGGVAGLLLTIGTSVETDILIFERIREMLRKGNNYKSAINLGYKKTWPTLWDSNVVTLIIAALLYTVGGTVRGFALVLALGIFIGLFNTFVYTRPFMTLFANIKFFQKNWFFATNEKRDK
jgi:protein-export membrane protein SecD